MRVNNRNRNTYTYTMGPETKIILSTVRKFKKSCQAISMEIEDLIQEGMIVLLKMIKLGYTYDIEEERYQIQRAIKNHIIEELRKQKTIKRRNNFNTVNFLEEISSNDNPLEKMISKESVDIFRNHLTTEEKKLLDEILKPSSKTLELWLKEKVKKPIYFFCCDCNWKLNWEPEWIEESGKCPVELIIEKTPPVVYAVCPICKNKIKWTGCRIFKKPSLWIIKKALEWKTDSFWATVKELQTKGKKYLL